MLRTRGFLTTLAFIVTLCLFGSIGVPHLVSAMNPIIAPGAVITVNTITDEYNADGDCSLREAILAANRNIAVDACTSGTVEQDTVMIPSGVYTLTIPGRDEDLGETGDLDVIGATILQGADSTIIHANQVDRVLDVVATTATNVQIRNLAVTHGATYGFESLGAGIRSTADLELFEVHIYQNYGGGVRTDGMLEMRSSTISSNLIAVALVSQHGGSGLNSSGTAHIENSLIALNVAFHYDGSTVYGAGWFHRSGTATLHNSTISGNRFEIAPFPIPDSGSGYGANMYGGGTISVTDSTIGEGFSDGKIFNTPASVEGNIQFRNSIVMGGDIPACVATVESWGYNISNGSDCTDFTETGDVLGSATINLSVLADNGGPTMTMALGAGSSAIDSGDPTQCPATDQRGILRPQDGDGDGSGGCDRGAYEVGEGDPEPTATATASPSPTSTPTPVASSTPSATNTVPPTSTTVPSVTPSATVTPEPSATPTDTIHTLFMPLVMEVAHAGLPDEDLLLYSMLAEDLEGVDFTLGMIPPDSESFQLTTGGDNSQPNERFLHPYGLQGIFAPDGRHLTFTKLEEAGSYLWVMAADGSNARRLTDESVSWAEWASDSQTIVYWVTRTGGPAALRTTDIETSTVVTVANDAISHGVWHLTQPKLYYVADNPVRIVSVNADGTDPLTVYTMPTGMTSLSLVATLPGRILFHMANTTGSDVYTIWNNGIALTRITNDPEGESTLHISPDGSQLFYTHPGMDKIYLASTTGEPLWEYTLSCDACSPDVYFAWAPDGSELAFSWTHSTLTDGDYGLYRLATNGAAAPALIDQGQNRYRGVAYSPNSRYLAYSGAEREPYRIMLLDRTTNTTIPWLESDTYHFVWTWRPRL